MQAASVGNRPAEMRLEYPMSSSANLVFARARCMVRQGMHGVREALGRGRGVTPVCQGAGEMSATEYSVYLVPRNSVVQRMYVSTSVPVMYYVLGM